MESTSGKLFVTILAAVGAVVCPSTANAQAPNLLINGGFEDGPTGWTQWRAPWGNNETWDFNNQESGLLGTRCLRLSTTGQGSFGVYQEVQVTPGNTYLIDALWKGTKFGAWNWYEILLIDGPFSMEQADSGDDATVVRPNYMYAYDNNTYFPPGSFGWVWTHTQNAPPNNQIDWNNRMGRRTATGNVMTVVLKAGACCGTAGASAWFDGVLLREDVPPPATLASLPEGFAARTYTFPVSHMVSMAQSPVSRRIYAVRNAGSASDTRLYRVNVEDPTTTQITTTQITSLGTILDNAQGITFDAAGNMYLANQYGRIVKGTVSNPGPSETFSFSVILTLPEPQLGTFHGVGGVAVGPDNKLYINSGSETHYGPEQDKGFNMRILRCNLDGSNVETFCEGIRNTFDLAFRADGKLFGVENGPNGGCDYGEEFNLLEEGFHYGFPYKFGSDISGSDSSITCTGDPGKVGPQPLPVGLNPRPAWANYGPNGRPGPGQPGYVNGGPYHSFHPHSSPDGLSFYEPILMDPAAIKFPVEFHGRAFVSRFGHLEPGYAPVGYDVLSLRLDDANEGFWANTFLAGLGRAMDVLCAHNGRLYIIEFNQQTNFDPTFATWNTLSRLYEVRYTIPQDQPSILLNPTVINRQVHITQNLPDDTFTVTNAGAPTLDYTISVNQPWLSVTPEEGASAGLGDVQTHTITYSAAGLPVGTHAAQITVSDPAAANSPQTLNLTLRVRTVRADFDQDGDVDQSDFAFLQNCFSGPGVIAASGCEAAVFDGDGDVDAADFDLFLQCVSGPNVLADPDCDANYQ